MRRSSKRGLGLMGKSSRKRHHDEDIDYREQYDDEYDDYPEDDYEDDYSDVEDDDYYEDDREYDESGDYERDDQEYDRETDGIDDDEYDRDYDDDRDYYEDDDYEDDDLYEGDEDYRNVEDIDDRRNFEHDEYDEDDEDYDDVYDDYVSDRRGGRSDRRIITEFSAVEKIAAFIFVLLIAGAVATGVFYKKAMDKNHEIDSFASVGENYGNTEIVGESGLIAVADAQRAKLEAAQLVSEDEAEEEQENSEKEDENATINVSMSVATIKSDIKIKFTNSKTGTAPLTLFERSPKLRSRVSTASSDARAASLP